MAVVDRAGAEADQSVRTSDGTEADDRAAPSAPPAGGRRPHRFAMVFAAAFVALFAVMGAFSLATPMRGAPDEGAQLIKAAAVVRGELVGAPVPGHNGSVTKVVVPAYFARIGWWSCFAGNDALTPRCVPPVSTRGGDRGALTYVGRYPPAYYALVGLPSLVTTGSSAVYAMRLVSAAPSAALLGLAFAAALCWSRRRPSLLLAGLAVAATPTALFLGGVVNPNGLEIAAAVCMWCSGLLVLERRPDPPPGLVALLFASATVTALTRPISPLWVVLCAAALVALGGWRSAWAFAHRRSTIVGLAVTAVACAATALWSVIEHANRVLTASGIAPHASGWSIARLTLGDSGIWYQEMVGDFGWHDTLAPFLTFAVWALCLGGLVLLGVLAADRRGLAVLGSLVALTVAAPVVFEVVEGPQLGMAWFGRYGLALAVGIPLVASHLAGRAALGAPARRRLVRLVVVATALGQLVAFCAALGRYTSGSTGPLDPLTGPWQPPASALGVAVVATVGLAGLTALVWWGTAAGAGAGTSGDEQATTRHQASSASS